MEIITGVFESPDRAIDTVQKLRSLGLTDKQIGLVTPEGKWPASGVRVPVTDTEDSGMGQAMGAAVGGAMGAAGGATVGLAAATLLVPGVGPVVALGVLGAVLLGASGAAVGAVVGDTFEETLGEGIPHEDIYLYEDSLRHGKSIVVVYADDDTPSDSVHQVIRSSGALSIEKLRDQWWNELRDDEFLHYQSSGRDFSRDELSYRRGFEAAQLPECRGKSYSEAERSLKSRYSDEELDAAFRTGYDRGLDHQPTLTETR